MRRFTVYLGIDVEADDIIDAAMKFQDLINGPNPGWDVEVIDSKNGKKEIVEYSPGCKA